jgi:hypothetical protein
LAAAQFESWAVIVDKTTLPDSFKIMSGTDPDRRSRRWRHHASRFKKRRQYVRDH